MLFPWIWDQSHESLQARSQLLLRLLSSGQQQEHSLMCNSWSPIFLPMTKFSPPQVLKQRHIHDGWNPCGLFRQGATAVAHMPGLYLLLAFLQDHCLQLLIQMEASFVSAADFLYHSTAFQAWLRVAPSEEAVTAAEFAWTKMHLGHNKVVALPLVYSQNIKMIQNDIFIWFWPKRIEFQSPPLKARACGRPSWSFGHIADFAGRVEVAFFCSWTPSKQQVIRIDENHAELI